MPNLSKTVLNDVGIAEFDTVVDGLEKLWVFPAYTIPVFLVNDFKFANLDCFVNKLFPSHLA